MGRFHWRHCGRSPGHHPCVNAIVLWCFEALTYKAVGAVGIVLGTVALWIPFFVAIASCGPFVDGLCEDLCGPGSTQCEQRYKDNICIGSQIYVYVMIFGWAACSLGIAGVILACCVCCTDCCTRKTDVPITAPPVSLQTLGRQSEVEWQLHVAAAWCLSSAFSCRRLGRADFWGPVLGHHRCHIQKPPPTGFLPYLSSSSIISFGSVSISTQCEVFELAWQTKHNF